MWHSCFGIAVCGHMNKFMTLNTLGFRYTALTLYARSFLVMYVLFVLYVTCAGRGIPNNLIQNNHAMPVDESLFPPALLASQHYTNDIGTVLTAESCFGEDPYRTVQARQLCETQFNREFPDSHILLSNAVNGNVTPLQNAIVRLIQLTHLSVQQQ